MLYLVALSLATMLLFVPTAWAQPGASGAQEGSLSLWMIALIIAAAGLVGGLTSTYVINNRSLLSEAEVVEEEAKNVEVNTNRRGSLSSYLVNALLGFVAAGVFWAGYGTYSALT